MRFLPVFCKRFKSFKLMETDFTTSAKDAAVSALPPATGSSNINLTPSERIVSTFGGAALAVMGLRNIGSIPGIATLLSGGYLLVRGLSGYCPITNRLNRPSTKQASAMEATGTFIINKPRSDVYAFWRKLENLPKFMQHLDEVKELDDAHSKWTAKLPGGVGHVSWDAQIVEDISGELISWSSLPGSTVDNAGEVRFKDAPGNKGTEIRTTITYRLPGGDLGSVAGKLFNPAVENMMREDLRSFQKLMDAGATPSPKKGKSRKPDEALGNQKEFTSTGIS
jgi:uncharacterized membrane protein